MINMDFEQPAVNETPKIELEVFGHWEPMIGYKVFADGHDVGRIDFCF